MQQVILCKSKLYFKTDVEQVAWSNTHILIKQTLKNREKEQECHFIGLVKKTIHQCITTDFF